MSNLTLYAGVDYHQHQLQLCIVDHAGRVRVNRAVANDAGEVARVLRGLGGPVASVALEACCGAADLGEELLGLGDWRVELAHAGYVARLKQSPDKHDFGDARLVADLTRVGYLPRVWLPPASVRDLRQLVGHRQRLVDQRRALKLRVGALLREQRVKVGGGGGPSRWSVAWVARVREEAALSEQARWVAGQLLDEIDHVSGQVRRCEQRLRAVTAADAVVARLRRIEGVGEVTAWMLRAWVGRFDRFRSGKQLSRYCGLSPRNASSGTRQADAGLVDAANKQLRAVLIQAGHRLARGGGRWGRMAEALLRRGKPRNVVVAAVANRWVRSMHHRMLGGGD